MTAPNIAEQGHHDDLLTRGGDYTGLVSAAGILH